MENTFKMKSLSLLLKINIWTAFFVLLAGIVIIAGCSSPQGGETKEEQVIDQPTNGGQTNEGNENGNKENEQENTGNENENTNTGNENENTNTGNENENTNTGNENENTNTGNENENTNTGNENENTNTGNENENTNTGNENENTNTGNENENTNTGNENENTNTGNENENTNTGNDDQQTTTPVVYGGEPYDKVIGNGNYILHNFIGNNTVLTAEKVEDATKYYLGKADTYVKGLADDLDQSLADRPAAKNYLTDYVTTIENINTFYQSNPADCLNNFANIIAGKAKPYIADIIKNLNNEDERYAFYAAYRILANESYKEGLGTYREVSSSQMEAYEEEKAYLIKLAKANKVDGGPFVNVDIEKDYSTNNFAQTTAIMDDMLATAAQNRGLDLQASDLRQVVNLTMKTNALYGMNQLVEKNLQPSSCAMSINMNATMTNAIYEAEQEQSMGL